MVCTSLVKLAYKLDLILDDKRFGQRIQSLHEKLVFFSTYVDDFRRESAAKLEAQIRNAVDRAEHVLDYLIDRNDENEERCRKEVDKLIEEIDLIVKEGMQIRSSRPFSRLNSKETAVGIEEDLMAVKEGLYGEPSDLRIIPIVGMGGTGKTTLARYAFDDPSTFNHFDIRVWVTASRNSTLRRIILGILGSSDESDLEYVDNEILVQRAYKYLKMRRYVIVMDDVWDTNVWDDVRRVFPDDCNGSRVIVTTRELDVASYVDSRGRPHEMHLMRVDRSWMLLKQKVFGQEICPLELEKIGKVIARNCRGLPLAIVVIAGVLSRVNLMRETWEKIARNVTEAVNSDQQFSNVIFVSYINLPHHLRPCFLYMGGFPEDQEINVSRLIKLWAAEGFLITKDQSKGMEELGYEYLEDLAKRCLVLISKKRYNGKIKAIKIHDVLRDLCLRKAREEEFLHVIDEFCCSFPNSIENSRRLSISSYISGQIPDVDSSTIHTLLLFDHWAFDSWKNLRLLRVLDAMSVTLRSSDDIRCIGELSDLRHLAFTCEPTLGVVTLAVKSMYQLRNLQTLIVRIIFRETSASYSLSETLYTSFLEFEIWRMPQLRHLILLDGFLLDPFPETCPEDLVLENLHTLSRMKDFKCSERILEMMPNLKKLGIVYSYKGTYKSGWSKYGLNKLVHLLKLEKLSLYAEPYPNLKNDVSQNIAFPVALKKLTLSGCRFPWGEMTLVGSLPNLEVLKLKRHACDGSEWETVEGEFCQLKLLVIDTTDLQHWITESCSHFPRLERLVLYNCTNLREIPYEIGEIPTLELIEVDSRDSSIVESARRIQEEQQSFGNDLQVRLLKPPAQELNFKRYAI